MMTIYRLLAVALCAVDLLQMSTASSASGVHVPPQTPAAVLAAGAKAAAHWMKQTPIDNNDWTGSTFLIGLMEYYKATAAAGAADASALGYATRWAEHYDYKLCTESAAPAASSVGTIVRRGRLPPGKHVADHQLCAATYIELYKLDHNASHLADVKAVLGEEIAHSAATSNYWSWVDALFMSMSVYSRLGNVTGDARYAAKQVCAKVVSALFRTVGPAAGYTTMKEEGGGGGGARGDIVYAPQGWLNANFFSFNIVSPFKTALLFVQWVNFNASALGRHACVQLGMHDSPHA